MPWRFWPKKDACKPAISSGRRLSAFDPAVSEWGNPSRRNVGTIYHKSGSHPVHNGEKLASLEVRNWTKKLEIGSLIVKLLTSNFKIQHLISKALTSIYGFMDRMRIV